MPPLARSLYSERLEQLDLRVDGPQILGIAGDDGVTALAGAHDDRDVDDVRYPDVATYDPNQASTEVVQGNDLREGRIQQPGDTSLASAATPGLGDHACRDSQRRPLRLRNLEQRDHPPAAAFQRDQRSGVERRSAHSSPRARLAHA